MAILASWPCRRASLGPLADQLAGLEVVGGEIGVGGGDRVERRVERDDEDAGVARLLRPSARSPSKSLGTSRMPLAPAAISSSIAATWPSLSPSDLAGVGLQREAEFLGLGLEALLHLDEERIGVGLGDQADDVGRVRGRGRQRDAPAPRPRRSIRIASFLDMSSSRKARLAAFALRARALREAVCFWPTRFAPSPRIRAPKSRPKSRINQSGLNYY